MESYLPKELLVPDAVMRPVIHMSPFSGKFDFHAKDTVPEESEVIAHISAQLFGQPLEGRFTKNGRHALALALQSCVRNEEFVVSIITPSKTGYVSTKVTSEINKCCKWVMGYDAKADIYLLLHEFGRKASLPQAVQQSRKPVIEDFAYGMVDPLFSEAYKPQGHYLVYSLSKAFPIQYGGLLFFNGVPYKDELPSKHLLSEAGRQYLLQTATAHFHELHRANHSRMHTYKLMQQISVDYGFREAFPAKKGELPHAFLVQLDPDLDASAIKTHMNLAGVESGVLEGGHAYYLPCHQRMNLAEIEYMFHHLSEALKNADI